MVRTGRIGRVTGYTNSNKLKVTIPGMVKELVVVSARIFNGAPFSTGSHGGTVTNYSSATVNLRKTPKNIHNALQYLDDSRPDYGDAFDDLLKTTPLEALEQWKKLVHKNYYLPADARVCC